MFDVWFWFCICSKMPGDGFVAKLSNTVLKSFSLFMPLTVICQYLSNIWRSLICCDRMDWWRWSLSTFFSACSIFSVIEKSILFKSVSNASLSSTEFLSLDWLYRFSALLWILWCSKCLRIPYVPNWRFVMMRFIIYNRGVQVYEHTPVIGNNTWIKGEITALSNV